MRELRGLDTLIVDGRNLLWRCAHANPELSVSTDEGEVYTGGIYGFVDSLCSTLKRLESDVDVVIAWEGSKRHRVDILPDYKLRKPNRTFEALSERVNIAADYLKEIISYSGWSQATAPEWEADDVMGTVSLALNEIGSNAAILSNDRDMLQCLRNARGASGWTRQIVPGQGVTTIWTPETLATDEDWGVSPDQVVLVKTLAGDSSDCYKGAPGIGQKWACRIAREYETTDLEHVISQAVKGGRILGSEKKALAILENLDYIRACNKVAKIQTDVKINFEHGTQDSDLLEEVFHFLRFKSLLTNRASMQRILR